LHCSIREPHRETKRAAPAGDAVLGLASAGFRIDTMATPGTRPGCATEIDMPLERLDHYFVYASDLERTRHFYGDVLGLEQGPRPAFGFPGYWFYLEGRAVVHVGNDEFEGGHPGQAGTPRAQGNTGPVDHIAFRANDIEDFERRLSARGLDYRRREVPDFALSQLFVKDPDGVTIELNFFHGNA
jgi:catechol 2,3-dioxygenase-like lactoylglutathione lyase family enzyme